MKFGVVVVLPWAQLCSRRMLAGLTAVRELNPMPAQAAADELSRPRPHSPKGDEEKVERRLAQRPPMYWAAARIGPHRHRQLPLPGARHNRRLPRRQACADFCPQ